VLRQIIRDTIRGDRKSSVSPMADRRTRRTISAGDVDDIEPRSPPASCVRRQGTTVQFRADTCKTKKTTLKSIRSAASTSAVDGQVECDGEVFVSVGEISASYPPSVTLSKHRKLAMIKGSHVAEVLQKPSLVWKLEVEGCPAAAFHGCK